MLNDFGIKTPAIVFHNYFKLLFRLVESDLDPAGLILRTSLFRQFDAMINGIPDQVDKVSKNG